MDSFAWDFSPPRSQALEDHAVPLRSRHLEGRRIALLVTGGIASFKAPQIARSLRRRGAEVTAFCSQEALHYVGVQALEWATLRPLITELSWRAEHLSDAEPFDAWLVAPATCNTIAKMAHGIADTVVTAALASALGRLQQGCTAVLVAPTLHGSMHTPILERNCRDLQKLGVRFLPPRDAYGKHNLPDEELLCAAVCRALSRSPLRDVPVLVTGGPTPVALDGVRRIVNRFTGRLGAQISEELLLRGADVAFILGAGGCQPPAWLPCRSAASYDDYKRLVLDCLADGQRIGIFSAGVADYRPRTVVPGKIPSGNQIWTLELEPTEKVIDLVAAVDPNLYLVTFKYLEGLSEQELIAAAQQRLSRFPLVVANRGEDIQGQEQTAWLVSRQGETRMQGKQAIAAGICDHLEAALLDGSA